MKNHLSLAISFSARKDGNCDNIAAYISRTEGKMLAFRDLSFHPCVDCTYECMTVQCKYRKDDIYKLFALMEHYEKIFIVVPMYCGNPSALYYIFNERSQDYFMHNDNYEEIIRKLYFIGIYGDVKNNPDYLACFDKWFADSEIQGHVLGVERHRYGQKIEDKLLDIEEVRKQIESFVGVE